MFFINFEDPRLSDLLTPQLLDGLIRYAHDKAPGDGARYFFLDEVQNVEGWEKWLRLKIDRPTKDHFVITGSNAALLSVYGPAAWSQPRREKSSVPKGHHSTTSYLEVVR